MEGNTFVTTRGDRISLAFGRRPTVGRTGSGPYPRVDEVGEQSVHGFCSAPLKPVADREGGKED